MNNRPFDSTPQEADFCLAAYDYPLQEERIASVPCDARDNSRLLVCTEQAEQPEEIPFVKLGEFLRAGDLLVLNRSQPDNVRLNLRRQSGGRIETLLFSLSAKPHERGCLVDCLLRGGRKLKIGELLSGAGFAVEVAEQPSGAYGKVILPLVPEELRAFLQVKGEVPLPPYIIKRRKQTGVAYGDDPQRYRTVYGDRPGGVAATTAGFHFTEALLAQLQSKGIGISRVQLDVGSDTFLPIRHDDIRQHQVHAESFNVEEECVQAVRDTRARGGRVIAVGTTVTRALESAARDGELKASSGKTDLTIMPGHAFKVIDGMLTNFHFPRSSLLVMVAALVGRERLLRIYAEAIKRELRMFSYGDCMLYIRRESHVTGRESGKKK